ncbi:hypothetical protein JZ751_015813 [Albula glossodonta]|uniref:Uncharacterized protein n=1 Tax=Albula glossodonta TaxID=121402 RepID=A0A8T2MUU8_9TELE|nr:hypothetical protein JZ751_015813 [Albula glossodonta]
MSCRSPGSWFRYEAGPGSWFWYELQGPWVMVQDDDVTYSEVRIRDSAPPPAENSNGPADTGDQSCSEIRRNYSSLTEENAKLQRDYSTLTEENAKLQRDYSTLNNNVSMCTKKLQEEKSHILSALAKKIAYLQKYCNNQSGVLVCNSCPEGWKLWRSKCYYFSTDWKTWRESHKYCTQQGADLVIIESKEEQIWCELSSCVTTWAILCPHFKAPCGTELPPAANAWWKGLCALVPGGTSHPHPGPVLGIQQI